MVVFQGLSDRQITQNWTVAHLIWQKYVQASLFIEDIQICRSTRAPYKRLGAKSVWYLFSYFGRLAGAQFPNPICMFSGWKQLQINLRGGHRLVGGWGEFLHRFSVKVPLSQIHPKKNFIKQKSCDKSRNSKSWRKSIVTDMSEWGPIENKCWCDFCYEQLIFIFRLLLVDHKFLEL